MADLFVPVLPRGCHMTECRIVHRGGVDGEWVCATCDVSFGHSIILAQMHLLHMKP